MKKIALSLLANTLAFTATAQDVTPLNLHFKGRPECGFEQVLHKGNISYQQLLEAYQAANNSSPNAAKGTGVVYDIPVVFHIVYNTPSLNIPDSVVFNQIKVLNRAYRKQHADTGNTRPVFKALSGDAEIQFHLATVDPQGNPTTGITRTSTPRAYFGVAGVDLDSLERIKKTAQGGKDPWPKEKYLNIWVGNLSDGNGQLGVLGYAIPPLNPLPAGWPNGAGQELASLVDGVVLQTHSVGDNSPLNAMLQGIYTKGRCAVHEVGHYLGLQHIFGSNGGGATPSCGAIADDGIGDTPVQSEISFDANSGTSCPPATKNTCNSGSGDLPDMWENYMDYTRDACQTMFTHGQIALIRGVMANQRAGLVAATSVPNIPRYATAVIYPNPATSQLSVQLADNINRMQIVNFMGQKVMTAEGAAANSKQYDISRLPAGNYLLILEANGRQYLNKFSKL